MWIRGDVPYRAPPVWQQTPLLLPRSQPAGFDFALDSAQRQAPAFEPVDRREDRGTFGPDDRALGVYGAGVTPTRWPFRIFIEAGVDADDNAALRAQMAATGVLDPRPFGTRPAAPADAEYGLQPGEMVWALDATRMGHLEEQRGLLARIGDPAHASQKEDLQEQLADAVIREIDYASTRQAVPDFDALAAPLAQRAPQDATYRAALDAARTHFERRWSTEGRDAGHVGRLLELARDGDYSDVAAEAQRQLVAVADETAAALGDRATPEAIAAAIDRRAGVYLTFDAADATDPARSDYLAAVRQGLTSAGKEVFVDRPIAAVRRAAGLDPNGTATRPLTEAETSAMLAKLAEVTDPRNAMPGQVQDIISDPRILSTDPRQPPGLLNRAIDRLAQWTQAPAQPSDGDALRDLARISQSATYADSAPPESGIEPGRGKAMVDAIARLVVDRVAEEPRYGAPDEPRNIFENLSPMSQFTTESRAAAASGDVALFLAIADRADARTTDGRSFYDGLRDASVDAVRQGIEDFDTRLGDQTDQLVEDAGFFAHPLINYGQGRTEAQQLADIEALRRRDPEAARRYDESVTENGRLHERREGIQFAVDQYRPDLSGVEGFDREIGDDPLRPDTEHDSVVEAAGALPEPLAGNAEPDTATQPSLWFQRSQRLFVTHFALEGLKSVLPENKYRYALLGSDGMSPDELRRLDVDDWYNPRLLSRFSGGLSTYLFMQNATAIAQDPASQWNDYLYVPVHATFGMSQLASAALPDSWKEAIWGTDPSGLVNTPFNERYTAAVARINRLNASEGVKQALRHVAGGVLKDVPDAAYVVVDSINSAAYFSRGDWVRGTAFALSTLGDASFMAGAAAGVSAATGGTGLVLGLSASAWTGIGAVLMLAASGINYFKGMYDNAHTYDGADRRYLEHLGVRPEIAEVVSRHRTRSDGGWSAGPVLTAAFRQVGKSDADMVAYLNGLTSDEADRVATLAKDLNVLHDGEVPATDDHNSGTLDPNDMPPPQLWTYQLTPDSIEGFRNRVATMGHPIA
jgi:hypothetical protein